MTTHLKYILQIADNALVLGQRLSEWCGHGPVLEQDIALTNIALDQIGQAKLLYQHASEVEGLGRSEDDLAYLRDSWQYFNVLLVELPNVDFAYTIVRQFIMDCFNIQFFKTLQNSTDQRLAEIASKSLKEIKYHNKYSSSWMLRLGDGTETSNEKVQQAVIDLWEYTSELFEESEADKEMREQGIGVDLLSISDDVYRSIKSILKEANISIPKRRMRKSSGKDGIHTEHLGYILAELQYLQKMYPGLKW